MISVRDIAEDCGLTEEEALFILDRPIMREIGLGNWMVNAPMATHFYELFAPHTKPGPRIWESAKVAETTSHDFFAKLERHPDPD